MSDISLFNCDCLDENTEQGPAARQTLAELRVRLLRRLGYSAQAANPPPGMNELLEDFLQSAQRELYVKNPSLRLERFFRWTMEVGQRFYGLQSPDQDTDNSSCYMPLNEYRITWVGMEDLNEAWYPLIKGIDPMYYTRTAHLTGWPSFYEIRACIEIWPAPSAAYKLWVKGEVQLGQFTEDDDRTSFDSEAIFLLALGNAKSHYGQRDANTVLTQAGNYLMDLKAGKHLTARYVPQTAPWTPLTPPKFLPLGNEPS